MVVQTRLLARATEPTLAAVTRPDLGFGVRGHEPSTETSETTFTVHLVEKLLIILLDTLEIVGIQDLDGLTDRRGEGFRQEPSTFFDDIRQQGLSLLLGLYILLQTGIL